MPHNASLNVSLNEIMGLNQGWVVFFFFLAGRRLQGEKSVKKRMAEPQKISQLCGLYWKWMRPAGHAAFLAE